MDFEAFFFTERVLAAFFFAEPEALVFLDFFFVFDALFRGAVFAWMTLRMVSSRSSMCSRAASMAS